ncbi:hypothetical protein LPUS_00159 [Lasallia pustulata]|uniref:Rhodopsin domain-containing protein n=1 Tax=Lasallia pustulata TaxID=136370 RepID=A0A1W5CVH5_9LECA|nr:hypothetical protein LPUS_00159 [Lasallia pustulata]
MQSMQSMQFGSEQRTRHSPVVSPILALELLEATGGRARGISIPISLLWKVEITVKQKVALAGIFSLAVITMTFAIVRVTVISILTQQPDVSWLYIWSFVEQTVAIIVVCLASFRALFTRESRHSAIPHGGTNLRKLFLPAAIRNNGQITTSISASGETETKSLATSSDESNMSFILPDKVHVRHEINQFISPSDIEHGSTEVVEDHPRSQS